MWIEALDGHFCPVGFADLNEILGLDPEGDTIVDSCHSGELGRVTVAHVRHAFGRESQACFTAVRHLRIQIKLDR